MPTTGRSERAHPKSRGRSGHAGVKRTGFFAFSGKCAYGPAACSESNRDRHEIGRPVAREGRVLERRPRRVIRFSPEAVSRRRIARGLVVRPRPTKRARSSTWPCVSSPAMPSPSQSTCRAPRVLAQTPLVVPSRPRPGIARLDVRMSRHSSVVSSVPAPFDVDRAALEHDARGRPRSGRPTMRTPSFARDPASRRRRASSRHTCAQPLNGQSWRRARARHATRRPRRSGPSRVQPRSVADAEEVDLLERRRPPARATRRARGLVRARPRR